MKVFFPSALVAASGLLACVTLYGQESPQCLDVDPEAEAPSSAVSEVPT